MLHLHNKTVVYREIEALTDNSSEWKKSPKVSFSEDDDTSIERVVKEYRESSELKKSGKVSFSEEEIAARVALTQQAVSKEIEVIQQSQKWKKA